MKLLSFALLMLCAGGARADVLLYNNTTKDTLDTVLYSAGPYTSLGDQIHLISAGIANQANVQMFNNGAAGNFDAELDFFDVGNPVGPQIGSFDLTGNSSTGSDIINLTFALGAGLAVPQDVIFAVSVSNMSPNMDLGVNMFEPPTVGSSDNSFMIAATAAQGFFELGTNSEDVYFQLSGTVVTEAPEVSSLTLLGTGLLVMVITSLQSRDRKGALLRASVDSQ